MRAIGVAVDEPTAVDAAELCGLSEAEYEEEQTLAQAALDAGLELCVSPPDGAEAATPVKQGAKGWDTA